MQNLIWKFPDLSLWKKLYMSRNFNFNFPKVRRKKKFSPLLTCRKRFWTRINILNLSRRLNPSQKIDPTKLELKLVLNPTLQKHFPFACQSMQHRRNSYILPQHSPPHFCPELSTKRLSHSFRGSRVQRVTKFFIFYFIFPSHLPLVLSFPWQSAEEQYSSGLRANRGQGTEWNESHAKSQHPRAAEQKRRLEFCWPGQWHQTAKQASSVASLVALAHTTRPFL